MFKVGITGGIGSGKSTVCKIFETFGIPIFNADIEAKKLLTTPEIIDYYYKEFGTDVFTDNALDRKKIADIVFSNKKALAKVNSFIHPLVNMQFEKWCKKYHEEQYIIKEAALLFESGLYKKIDFNILIIAPLNIRIERVTKRDSISKDQVIERINNQWDDKKKIVMADAIIQNDDSQMLLQQVLELHNKILTLAKKK